MLALSVTCHGKLSSYLRVGQYNFQLRRTEDERVK